MKKIYLLIGIFLLSNLGIEAQIYEKKEIEKPDSLVIQARNLMESNNPNNNYVPQVIPPSPESQIFQRYLNHEVNEVSGTPEINIPLYDIKINGLTIPITLSYDASGIKYDQFDGTIGVGWSIKSMGYRAFREVHGNPDDQYSFYKQNEFDDALRNHDYAAYGYYFLSFINSHEFWRIKPQKYQRQDSEYDIFSYLLPSSGGNFIITDRDKLNTAIIEKNRDKVTLNRSTGKDIETMQIIDENGFKYKLGGKNINGYWHSNSGGAYNGWPLKEITSPHGETIEFEYDVVSADFRNRRKGFIGLQVNNGGETISRMPASYFPPSFNAEEIPNEPSASTEFYLKKIKTPNTVVEFIYNIVEHDDDMMYLKNIIITNNVGVEIKRIGFNYNDYGYGKWHRILESVEEGKGSEKMSKYDLNYYLPNVNYITKITPDQWGYYSQSHSESRNHFSVVLHEELKDYKIKRELSEAHNFYNEPLSVLGYKDFYDRSKNYGLLHSFSLKRITFPTGGYTEYEYEPHKYNRQDGTTMTGGGQRVKRITSKSEESSTPILTEFKYGENEDGIGLANFPWFDESHFVRDSYYYEIKGVHWGWQSCVDCVGYQIQRSYMMNPIMPEFSKFNVSYKEISTHKADIENSAMTKMTSKYDILEQYKYDGLTNIAEAKTELSVHRTQGNQVEVYDYSLGLKPLLRERIYYNNELEPTRKEEYNYDNTIMKTYGGYKVRQNVSFHFDYSDCQNILDPYINDYDAESIVGSVTNPFTWVSQLCNYTPYFIKVGTNNLLLSKKTTDYTDGQAVVTEEKYNYDGHYQVKSKSQFNSQAIEQKEEYKYPYNFGASVYKAMINSNMIAPIIEKVVTYNKKNIFGEKIHYATFKNLILPSMIETSTQGINNYQPEIIFTEYDKKGNIVEYMTKDGLYTVIVWGYNYQYPIAKMENMRYKDVGWSLDDLANLNYIDDDDPIVDDFNAFLASLPDSVHLTTYRYDPLIGLTSITDPSGRTTYYEYDSFGRLARIKNSNWKVVEEYNYHYSNK